MVPPIFKAIRIRFSVFFWKEGAGKQDPSGSNTR